VAPRTLRIVSWVLDFAFIVAIGGAFFRQFTGSLLIFAAVFFAARLVRERASSAWRQQRIRDQLAMLAAVLREDAADLRCTYHVPKRRPLAGHTELRQAFDYLPDGGGGGRCFPIDKGIIAKAYEHKAPKVENFRDDADYHKRMMEEYNYTPSELRQRTADRRSYLCIPLVDENHQVLGLVYLDSNTAGTFPRDDDNPRRRIVRAAAECLKAQMI